MDSSFVKRIAVCESRQVKDGRTRPLLIALAHSKPWIFTTGFPSSCAPMSLFGRHFVFASLGDNICSI